MLVVVGRLIKNQSETEVINIFVLKKQKQEINVREKVFKGAIIVKYIQII